MITVLYTRLTKLYPEGVELLYLITLWDILRAKLLGIIVTDISEKHMYDNC